MANQEQVIHLGDQVTFVNGRGGLKCAALVIKVVDEAKANLVFFDPENGVQQVKLNVPYFDGIAPDTFHYLEDEDEAKTTEEAAAQKMAAHSQGTELHDQPVNVPTQEQVNHG